MINLESTIPEFLEFLNLPIETTIFSKETLPKSYVGTYVYIKYARISNFRMGQPANGKIHMIYVEKANGCQEPYKHREDGPACIEFNYNSIIIRYYINNNRHRVGKPAYLRYVKGCLVEETYYLNDKVHNSIGPAHRVNNARTNVWENYYYLNDKSVNKDFYLNRMEKRNAASVYTDTNL